MPAAARTASAPRSTVTTIVELLLIAPSSANHATGRGGGIYTVVGNPDMHAQRARAAGAELTNELHDTDYGSREYSARDPEGNVWHFGTYRPFEFDHNGAD